MIGYLDKLNKGGIDIYIIGIGNNDSKERFCKYTKLPEKYLKVVPTTDLHDSLLLEAGVNITSIPLINLTISLICNAFNNIKN